MHFDFHSWILQGVSLCKSCVEGPPLPGLKIEGDKTMARE